MSDSNSLTPPLDEAASAPSRPTKNIPLKLDNAAVKEATWEDVMLTEDGKVEAICGVPVKYIAVAQLRTLCVGLQVRGYKSASKGALLQLLADYLQNKQQYEANKLDKSDKEKPRKTIHCTFRLVNILFSDKFANNFSRLGDMLKRHELDNSSNTGFSEDFWKRVQLAFVLDCPEYGHLLASHAAFEVNSINAGNVVCHDWQKLRRMWKELNSLYCKAKDRFSKSGTHDMDFMLFTSGKLDVYYLWQCLQIKPALCDYVDNCLPEFVFYDLVSAADGEETPAMAESLPPSLEPSDSTPNEKKRSRSRTDFAAVGDDVHQLVDNFSNKKLLNKQQIVLVNQRLLQEREQHAIEQFARIQGCIDNVRAQLRAEEDAGVKKELEGDLDILLQQKRKYLNEM